MRKISIVPRSNEFDSFFIDYFTNEKVLVHRRKINERSKGLSISELSYRIINHWENNGLIDVERGENGKGWRKYSFIDSIWISLIAELRKYGTSIENLLVIKNQLMSDEAYYGPSKYPILELYTSMYMMFNKVIYIIIFSDYRIEIVNESELEMLEKFNLNDSYIKIKLHSLINTVLKRTKTPTEKEPTYTLTKEEQSLLFAIRTGNYNSINVKMADNKIMSLEKHSIETEIALRDLIAKKDYGTITIQKANGKVVCIKNEIKEKF